MAADMPWPSVGYEERNWELAREYGVSKSARRRHGGAYMAATVPRIAELALDLLPDTNLAAEDAIQELVRFDAETATAGEIAPLAAVLLRTESASSSQIENLTAGARQIAIASLGEPAAHNAELIAANSRAIERAIQLAGALDGPSIIAMQQALLGDRSLADWRSDQVWIGGSSLGPHGAHFVPPHHEWVAGLMVDLERFMARDDLPVLQQAAVAHAQFETIHPFPDGNGRAGRALIHAMLRAHGVIRHVTVPVSAGLLVDTTRYFAALDAYRRGDPNPIVLVLADAVFAATANARILLADLAESLVGWGSRVTARSDSVAWRILPALAAQPVINTAFVVDTFGVSQMVATRALALLESVGVLREFTGKRRGRLWVADDVVGHLNAFAERTGRRNLET